MTSHGRQSKSRNHFAGPKHLCLNAASSTVAQGVYTRCFRIGVRKLPGISQPATTKRKSGILIQSRRAKAGLGKGEIANDD
jgi:hypothetical protein